VSAVDEALDRADAVRAGPEGLNLLLSRDDSASRRAARRSATGPLAGVPVVVKDNIATVDMFTTCGSRILAGYRSPFDATVVRRLREAGAVVIAKSNMDEFAMGSSTENSAYGPALNPIDPSRVPGGSSGGSAGAVAAGIVDVALGSETGGSVRQPAAFCGVVGVKPTYGRVSRFGLVAFASSLDLVGIFGKTVRVAARVLEVIAGRDENDSTSSVTDVPASIGRLSDSLGGMVIGWPRENFPSQLDPDIRRLCERARE
jgi:aspartyl-tRNA(Asn)/glutamyl-tRNA(Gln) amidotransferase subunit A